MEYGLIGEHLGHSFSKEIHEKLSDRPYELREVARDELAGFLSHREFKGINVTIPYKEAVLPWLDFISPEARKIGAVNTIVNRAGSSDTIRISSASAPWSTGSGLTSRVSAC